ncbi:hypothetical protein BX600DRAFT_158322, partial [Xylariales sp. PMI_506]
DVPCRSVLLGCRSLSISRIAETCRSYLYALRQKVSSLNLEIQQTRQHGISPTIHRGGTGSTSSPGQDDCYLTITDEVDTSSPSRTVYLGPGSAACLLARIIKASLRLHLEKDWPIPKRLLPNQTYRVEGLQELGSASSFVVLHDQRKEELYSILPPSTQRALIKHYINVVSPEYPFLPTGEETTLLTLENPVKKAIPSKNDRANYMINIVFAISAALVARDLEPRLSGAAMRFREDMGILCRNISIPGNRLEENKWTCRALCTLVILDIINPVTGNVWELLGTAMSSLQELREGYQVAYSSLDADFWGIEYSILKLEWSIQLHFGRLSPFNDTHRSYSTTESPSLDAMSQELDLLDCLRTISHAFAAQPHCSAKHLENLIPPPLRVELATSVIGIRPASLYIALHRLFTTSIPYYHETMDASDSRLFQIVAHSAVSVIDHISQLNESDKIISLWMNAERVLECGAVWAAYLISQRHSAGEGGARMETRLSMSPILKVSSLLASFAARWKAGSEFVNAWEILVELLWDML